MSVKMLTRAALLLALTLVFQSMRFVIPVTPFASTFVIGSLVNSCLLLAVETSGLLSAVSISIVAPIVAYVQGLLPIPVLVLPIACANILLVTVYAVLKARRWTALICAATVKTCFLYLGLLLLLDFVDLPQKLTANLLFVMSWPQFVTAVIGGILATMVINRLLAFHKT